MPTAPPATLRVVRSAASGWQPAWAAAQTGGAQWLLLVDGSTTDADDAALACRWEAVCGSVASGHLVDGSVVDGSVSDRSVVDGGVGVIVGNNHYVPRDPKSLLQAYLCQLAQQRLQAAVKDNVPTDVPADWLPATHIAFATALLRVLPAPDDRLSAAAQLVDWARRAYAKGARLRLLPHLHAEVKLGGSWPQAVAKWTQTGRDWRHLAHRHDEPHVDVRVAQRLGPYAALVGQIPRMTAQLGQIDRQLTRAGGSQAEPLAKLFATLTQLRAACALRGVRQAEAEGASSAVPAQR